MNNREKERQDNLEYITDDGGKRHFIFPMKLKDRKRVTELFTMVNDEFPVLNMPRAMEDEEGNVVKDENGNVVMNEEPFLAMMELLKMALHEDEEQFEQWLDIGMIGDVLYAFRAMSQLKKKMEMEIKMGEVGNQFMQG